MCLIYVQYAWVSCLRAFLQHAEICVFLLYIMCNILHMLNCKYSQFTLYSTIYSVSENLCVETCNSNNGNFLKFLCSIRISPYTYKGKNSELLQLYNVQYWMYIYCWWWCWCAVPGGWSGWGRGSRPRPPPPSLLHPPLLPHQPRIWALLSKKKSFDLQCFFSYLCNHFKFCI